MLLSFCPPFVGNLLCGCCSTLPPIRQACARDRVARTCGMMRSRNRTPKLCLARRGRQVVIDCVMMCFFYDSEKDRQLPTTDTIKGRWRKKRSGPVKKRESAVVIWACAACPVLCAYTCVFLQDPRRGRRGGGRGRRDEAFRLNVLDSWGPDCQ